MSSRRSLRFETGSALFGGDRWAFGAWMVTLARLGAGGVTTRFKQLIGEIGLVEYWNEFG